MIQTLFEEIKALGIEYDHHESDLYLPVNEQTTAILKRRFTSKLHGGFMSIVSTFKSCRPEDNRALWYEVMFQYPGEPK